MINRDFDLNMEPLWAIPQQFQDRVLLGLDRSDYRSFLSSGLYCAMNLFLLLIFGTYAYSVGEAFHSAVLFTLAGMTITGYAVIWFGGWYFLAKYFTTTLMAVLCLYLFYTGGLQNTGPLYYFVFPTAALFLHGRLRGAIWVIALLLMTILIWRGMFGFDVDRYNSVFVTRIIVLCLILAVLTCIPEYFRLQAERNLLLSLSDFEALTYGDLLTKLANRSLLEKMLQLEYNRNLRYDSACCLMFIEADPVSNSLTGQKVEFDNRRLLNVVATVLRNNLRVQDIAGRWENNCFMLVLPEISLDGAKKLAQRLLDEVRAQGLALGKYPLMMTLSIGIAELDKSSLQDVLNRAANSLLAAQGKKGNSYMAL